MKRLRYYLKLRRNVRDARQVLHRYSIPDGDVPVTLRGGAHFILRRASQDVTIFHRIFVKDEYRVLRCEQSIKGDVVDLGANVGLFACRIAPRARRVICYEPVSANYAQLLSNTQGLPNVTAVQAAISGAHDSARIHVPVEATFSGGHSQYPTPALHLPESYEDVPAVSLPALFERHAVEWCDLLKIDVEGAEYDILYHTPDAVFERIGRICGEYHYIGNDDRACRIGALAAFLNRHGFDVEVVPKRRMVNHGMFFATPARTASRPGLIYTGPGVKAGRAGACDEGICDSLH